jgi:hypothetical protein
MDINDKIWAAERRVEQMARDVASHADYIRECGAEPWAVYMCDKIKRGQRPQNETPVAVRTSAGEAMDLANELRRRHPAHSFTVGAY